MPRSNQVGGLLLGLMVTILLIDVCCIVLFALSKSDARGLTAGSSNVLLNIVHAI